MAKTRLPIPVLQKFQENIREQADKFKSIRQSMDQSLNDFHWDDRVAQQFKTRYHEGLEPLNTKLLPALDKYQQYLVKEIELAGNVLQD